MDLLARFKEHPLPFAQLLGIELVDATPECVVGELTVRKDLCTVPAVVHGGVIMAFADTLGALGTIANIDSESSTVTIGSATNFLAPAPLAERLTGTATPLHRGRSTMVWQTRITTREGRLVAVTTQTQLVLPRPVKGSE